MKPVALLFLLAGLSAPGVALAQSGGTPSPAKICADRWNEMKAKNQTGDQTYRDFAARCLSDAGAAPATEGKPAGGAPAAAPRRHTTPTGASAAAAQPSMKQCADLWSEMKAKNQTGDRTYRDFAQECLAGTGVLDDKPAPSPVKEKSAAPKPRTSVPSVAPRPAPDPAPELSRQPDASDREALNRCNGEWQAYKTRHNLTGAKAWHVFMARCLP